MAHNPHPHHQTQLASENLKPFDWAKEKEIRGEDVPVFKAAAAAYNHIIVVRATNEHSIQYIGRPHYVPKPIDCKPKTASMNALSMGKQVPCAGLVVDPTLLPNAFNSKKHAAATECWGKFTQGASAKEQKNKVFRRHGNAGFYAVDTYKASANYGCLMLTVQNPPDKDFRLDVLAYQEFRRKLNMCYVYGDYDLYGLIDVDKVLQASKGKGIAEKQVMSENLFGVTSFHSPNFQQIRHFLNQGIGTNMIQHGSQDTFGHAADKLYVFTPLENAYVMEGTEAAIREVYQLIFKEEPIQRSF